MTGQPRVSVSVVVPAHNPGLLIYRALKSVELQTLQPDQVIVVDDASNDRDTRRALEYFTGVDVLRTETRQGVSAARNQGIEASEGEFVAFLDADDEWLPTKLERQIAQMVNSSADLSLTGFVDRRVRSVTWGRRHAQGLFADLLVAGVPFNTSTLVVRRSAIMNLGGFAEDLERGEDTEFYFRAASAGLRATFVGSAEAVYHHDNEQSLTARERGLGSLDEVWRRIDAHCGMAPCKGHALRGAAIRHFCGRAFSKLASGHDPRPLPAFFGAFGTSAWSVSLRVVRALPPPARRLAAHACLIIERWYQQRRLLGSWSA